jgi:hypothetical protein
MLDVSTARRRLVLILVGCLAVVASSLAAGTASGANPAPVSISIDGIVGQDLAELGDLPPGAAPLVFARVDQTFLVDVSFYDSLGASAAFNSDVTLEITGTSNSGSAALAPSRVLVPKGNTSFSLPTSIGSAANQVVLTVKVVGKGAPKGVAPGVSYLPDADPAKDLRFDVVSDARIVNGDSGFVQGIGGDANCTDATQQSPVCGIVLLPDGAGAKVLLSVGACDPAPDAPYAPCFVGKKGAGGAVVQTLFAQPTTPYSVDSPATLVVKCDKTLCGTGAISGLTVAYSLTGNGALVDAVACPAKGTMATAGVPCVDYVQSKRDGSGDTHLFLLTDRDLRGGIG